MKDRDGMFWKHRYLVAALVALALGVNSVRASALYYSTLAWDGNPLNPRQSTIRYVQDDGFGDVPIVDLGGDTTYPIASPDGDWLYFQSNYTGRYQVYRSAADGAGVTNLSALANLGPTWQEAFGSSLSGDGSHIVYTVHDGSEGKVVYADSDGANAQFVAPQLGYTYMASLDWSGDRVVYSGPAQSYRLITADAPDGSPETLTPDHPNSYVPQYTPNGQTVVFLRNDGDIYSVDVASQQVQRLTQGNNYYEFHWSPADQHGSTDGPDISPDGTRIAYIGRENGVPQVHTMNLDGSNQQQITFGPKASGRVRWSPEGEQLSFVTFVDEFPELFVVNAVGGTPQQLTDVPEGGVYWATWEEAMVVPPQESPALSVINLTTRTTLFADNFEQATASQQPAIDSTGDYDPVASRGHWTVYESPGEPGSAAEIQVTNSATGPDPGPFEGTNYLRIFRSGDAGLTAHDLNAFLSAEQTQAGDVIRFSTMVNVPDDDANARGQIMLVGTGGDVATARAWVRPNGQGDVIAVGPGFTLLDTGLDYVPGVWQQWDLQYVIGSDEFTLAIDGVMVENLNSFAAGGVASVLLINGSNTAGSIYFDAAPTLTPDLNRDGVVDVFDVNLVSDYWNGAGPAGDANRDGVVDIFDVNVISDHWTGSGNLAVCEPSTGALLLASAVAASAGCRRSSTRAKASVQRPPATAAPDPVAAGAANSCFTIS